MFADRLKKSLLQAAIQGQLTEQLTTDGDARDLLKKIRAEKNQLVADKKIKAEKPLPSVSDDEIPFDIPDNWCWCRLGEIFTLQAGKFISAGQIKSIGNFPCYGGNGIRGFVKNFNREGRFPIIGRQGALCGNINLANGKFYATEHAVVVTLYKNSSPDWAKYFLTALNLNQYSTATAQPGLAVEKIIRILIPLPPLAEQERIVEKLDVLLSEVDELAKDERELVELEKNFPRRMKNSLLQAAIQGKLTEQLPSDGNARDLLRKIRAEKVKLIADKKIKAEKPLPSVSDDEIPFDLPDNWCWCRLGEVCNYVTNETILPDAMTAGKLLINLEDIEKDSGMLINRKFFDGNNVNSSKHIFRRGQVLFGKLRVYLNKVIIADDDGYCSSEILPLDFGQNILNRYAQVVLMSPTFLSYANACSYGTKMPRLGTKSGQLALFPLPPLAEQERIVERLDELLPFC